MLFSSNDALRHSTPLYGSVPTAHRHCTHPGHHSTAGSHRTTHLDRTHSHAMHLTLPTISLSTQGTQLLLPHTHFACFCPTTLRDGARGHAGVGQNARSPLHSHCVRARLRLPRLLFCGHAHQAHTHKRSPKHSHFGKCGDPSRSAQPQRPPAAAPTRLWPVVAPLLAPLPTAWLVPPEVPTLRHRNQAPQHAPVFAPTCKHLGGFVWPTSQGVPWAAQNTRGEAAAPYPRSPGTTAHSAKSTS